MCPRTPLSPDVTPSNTPSHRPRAVTGLRALTTHAVPPQRGRTSFCGAAVRWNDSPVRLKPRPSSALLQPRCSPTAEGAVLAALAGSAHPTRGGKGFLPGLAKLTAIQGSVRAGGKQGTGPLLSTAEHYQTGPAILPSQPPRTCPSPAPAHQRERHASGRRKR